MIYARLTGGAVGTLLVASLVVGSGGAVAKDDEVVDSSRLDLYSDWVALCQAQGGRVKTKTVVTKPRRSFKLVWHVRDFNGGPRQEINEFVFGYGKKQVNFSRQKYQYSGNAEVGARGLSRLFARAEVKIKASYFNDRFERTTKFRFYRATHRVTRYHGQNVYYRGVTKWHSKWNRFKRCKGVDDWGNFPWARGRIRINNPQHFGNISCRMHYRNPMARWVKRNYC